MDYPDPSTEYQIVKLHVPAISSMASEFMDLLFAVEQLRTTDLPYLPSIRESIALAKLLTSGVNKREAVSMTLIEVYHSWGISVAEQVTELLRSRGLPTKEG
jgi:hypothetical protein